MADPSLPAAVSARGLMRRYGTVRVLRGLDLDVGAGETLALFGSNGAGKTTLLQILSGLRSPDAGTVEVFGEPMPGDEGLRRRIGVLGHEGMVYADLTARENLEYYARLYGLSSVVDRATESLERVGLGYASDKPVRAFSRGMLQRVSLARALVHEPELVLLDEPFTGLDPQGAELLGALIADLKLAGVAIVMTTHDFRSALASADRAAVLHEGRIAWHSDDRLPDPAEMATIYAAAVGPGQSAAKRRGERETPSASEGAN